MDAEVCNTKWCPNPKVAGYQACVKCRASQERYRRRQGHKPKQVFPDEYVRCSNGRCPQPAREGLKTCEKCAARSRAKYHSGDKASQNLTTALRRFGLTVEDFEALLAEQGGVCAICDKPCAHYSRLSVDHCHDTKKVRGLLCNNCNRGIGLLGDNPERMERAMAYLTAA